MKIWIIVIEFYQHLKGLFVD